MIPPSASVPRPTTATNSCSGLGGLALMNLYLHQVEPHITLGDSIYETPGSQRFDVILTNPPFGTKGANQAPDREDFVVQTSNKQLNFLQHVLTILKPGGRAAVVVPDNVLFAQQAGEVFEVLMEDCDLHTVLRCPRGTFSPYTEGTKTNVIFFTKGQADRAHLDLRRPRQRPQDHQEEPAAQPQALRRVREVLRRRSERPEQAVREAVHGRSLAQLHHRRGQGAPLQARRL